MEKLAGKGKVMRIEIRGLKVGEGSVGGWVSSSTLFSSVRNIDKGDTTIYNQVFDESLGFLRSLIWYK